MLRFRVLFFTLILPLVLAVGVLWLGHGSARATQLLVHQPLTLHGGPGSAFSVLATLASGTKVEVLWCNAEASWCLVDNGEVEGWAPRAELITRDASANQPASGKASSSGATASSGGGASAPAASVVGPPASPNTGGGTDGGTNDPDGLHLTVSTPAGSASVSVSSALKR